MLHVCDVCWQPTMDKENLRSELHVKWMRMKHLCDVLDKGREGCNIPKGSSKGLFKYILFTSK